MTDAEARIARTLRAPYARIFQHDPESGAFTASVLEFPGCVTDGDSVEEANANLEEAIAGWVETELELGHDIPRPLADRDYSGRITVRLGPALHERATLLAQDEGISLNRWLSAAIASYAGEQPGSRRPEHAVASAAQFNDPPAAYGSEAGEPS